MPQIMCPNCGMTINLENRKRIDFNLIVGAAKKQSRTFTELLHITKLSRKTLSSRLKELCKNGTLIKKERGYKINAVSEFENNGRNLAKGFSRALHDKRIRTGLMLIAFLLCSSGSGYVLATFLTPKEIYQKPVILGNFTMALEVSNVKDLYAWQAVVTFNSSELEVTEITSREFLELDYPFFLNATDVGEGILLLGGTLYGSAPGKNGSGKLAAIVFGYFVDPYEHPRIVREIGSFETQLFDSEGSLIFDSGSTLKHLQLLETHK